MPSVWERRLTERFCDQLNLRDFFIAVESRDALEGRGRLWRHPTGLGTSHHDLESISTEGRTGRVRLTEPPERKRASLPDPERMAKAAPAFGVHPSEKRTLDLITDHPMIHREHLARWLGVSEGRVSQMMHSLVNTWGLVEQRGKRGDVRYTLSDEGIRYVTHRDRAELPTTRANLWNSMPAHGRVPPIHAVGIRRIASYSNYLENQEGTAWRKQGNIGIRSHLRLDFQDGCFSMGGFIIGHGSPDPLASRGGCGHPQTCDPSPAPLEWGRAREVADSYRVGPESYRGIPALRPTWSAAVANILDASRLGAKNPNSSIMCPSLLPDYPSTLLRLEPWPSRSG